MSTRIGCDEQEKQLSGLRISFKMYNGVVISDAQIERNWTWM